MRKIAVHQVDSFTNRLFGGNPAGIVTDADGLSDATIKQIAREMNLSETAFVLKPADAKATLKLRYFTPAGAEIPFCGHATVGALFQLAYLDKYNLGKAGKSTIQVETNVGVLSMSVVTSKGHLPQVTFTAPPVQLEPYRLQAADFAHEFGIEPSSIDLAASILYDSVLRYVYIAVPSLKTLGDFRFDFNRIRERFGKEGIVVFCLYSNETVSETSDLHARGLAPNVGVDEDPFTGSMQAGLVYAAKQNKYIDTDRRDIVVEQGDFVGRPGFANISHDALRDTVHVTASAIPVFSTYMEVSDEKN